MTASPAVEQHSLANHLAQAHELAARSGTTIRDALGSLTGMGDEELAFAIAQDWSAKFADAETLSASTPDFFSLPLNECLDINAVAVDWQGEQWIAIADPFDARLLAQLAQRLPERALMIAAPGAIQGRLAECEQAARASFSPEQPGMASGQRNEGVIDVSFERLEDDANPVVRLVNATLHDAIKLRVSDIHFERTASGLGVRYRIDGVLVSLGQVVEGVMAEEAVSRIKVMAELDISEQRIPQDGRLKVRSRDVEVDLRVSIMPTLFGEDAVLRLLDRRSIVASSVIRLEDLGFDSATISAIRRVARRPHGMLLVTGPTGSGKTTTLYASISEVHTGEDKIVTIEDPVEYRLPGVAQIAVNERKGLTFARGLRAILRHDPDKILVGEIRDEETAQIAVQAALTGHLVFTSVHANNVFDVIGRFLHMGVDEYSLSAALNGVVAQRLLRRVCIACAADVQPDVQILREFSLNLSDVADWRLRRGHGCDACRGTGYRGRRAIAEVFTIDDHTRGLLARKAPLDELRAYVTGQGQHDLRAAALASVASGETTLNEVLRVVG